MKKNRIWIAVAVVILLIITLLIWNTTDKEEKSIAAWRYSKIEDLEIPAINSEFQIVDHLAYSLQYNELHEQADWVAYVLVGDSLTGKAKRKDNFRIDTLVSTGSASPKDYKRSGYDRGHLAPAADMSWSDEVMSESFYMSNMSPQLPGFNRGIWKKLEEQVRDWAKEFDTLYVVTGPILEDSLIAIGENEVSVPNKYYKALLVYKKRLQLSVGFILPNESSSEELEYFAVSVDSVESVSHLDFFEKLPDAIEDEIESKVDIDKWFGKE